MKQTRLSSNDDRRSTRRFLVLSLCLSFLAALWPASHALSAPAGAAHEIVTVADPLKPSSVAQWVYDNTAFKADEWDKLLAELDKQTKAAPQGTVALTFVAPPHVHYGRVEPMLKALAAALPDHTIGLAARADPKQSAALKVKDPFIVLTPGEFAWRPVARIINPSVIDAIKPEPAPAVAPIQFRMRAGEKGTLTITIGKDETAHASLSSASAALKTMLAAGEYTLNSPLLIEPGRDVAWSHVVQAMSMGRLHRLEVIQIAPRPLKYARGTFVPKPRPLPPGVIGYGGGARKVVFVIDGPLKPLAVQRAIARDLRATVKGLMVGVQYAIVIPGPDGPVVMDPDVDFDKWLDGDFWTHSAESGGGKRLAAAIAVAAEFKPDYIQLASRGFKGEGNDSLESSVLLEQLAKAKIRISVISVLDIEKPAEGTKPVLQQIADSTGGLFKVLSEKSFEPEQP